MISLSDKVWLDEKFLRVIPLTNVPNERTKQEFKLSDCWETAPRENLPKIAEMDVEMTT